MTVEVTDNGSGRVTEGDTLTEGREEGDTIRPTQGVRQPSAFKPELSINYVNEERRR